MVAKYTCTSNFLFTKIHQQNPISLQIWIIRYVIFSIKCVVITIKKGFVLIVGEVGDRVCKCANKEKWKYLNNILPTNQVPYIGDYVRIDCALSNKFSPTLSKSSPQNIAAKMLYLSHQKNNLQQYILENVLDRSVILKPIDHADSLENFQLLDKEDLSNITCGSYMYQLRLSSCYIQ